MTKEDRDSCGYCKYFQIDGMFGLWCDKGLNWKEVEHCKYFERDIRGMTKEEMINELNNISDENKKLKKKNEQLKIRFNEEREKSIKFCRNIDTLTIENRELKQFKEKAFDIINKTIERETIIAENIEKITHSPPGSVAINRITIGTLEHLKKELKE